MASSPADSSAHIRVAALRNALSRALPDAVWSDERSFTEAGGDSLAFVQFVLALSDSVPVELLEKLSPTMPFAELEHIVSALPLTAARDYKVRADVSAGVAVTANRYAFLGQMPDKIDRWVSVSPALHVAAPYSDQFARLMVEQLLTTFDGLRLRMRLIQGRWDQQLVERNSFFHEMSSYDPLDTVSSDARILIEVEALVATLSLADQPVYFAFSPYTSGDGFVLVIIVHHALCDAMSKLSLYRHAVSLYGCVAGLVQQPSKSIASYADYVSAYYAANFQCEAEALDYWRNRPWQLAVGARRNYKPDPNAISHEVSRDFDLELSQYLLGLSREKRLPFSHVGMAAVASAYRLWSGTQSVSLGLVSHGRSGTNVQGDILGTVGWISEVVPFIAADDTALTASKEALKLNRLGRTFDYFRYLHDDAELRREFAELPVPALSLNILVSEHAAPAYALPVEPRDFGWDYSWKGERPYPISGGLVLSDGRIRISFDYDPNFASDEEMGVFLLTCIDRLTVMLDR